MSSIRRIISSQINGALSRGPITEEGKRRSSLNAIRHGLLAKYSVNDLESRETFDLVIQDHADSLQPEDGVQEGIIEEMVSAYWRMRRIWAVETGMINQAIARTSPDAGHLNRVTDAFCELAGDPKYNLLNIYEGRFHRRYHRALHSLLTLTEIHQRRAENKNEQTNPL